MNEQESFPSRFTPPSESLGCVTGVASHPEALEVVETLQACDPQI